MEVLDDYGDAKIILSLQEMADLRHLISIAVWIRSCQLAHPGVVRRVSMGYMADVTSSVEVDTRDLSVGACHADMVNGERYWSRITQLLEKAEALPAQALWRKEK